MTYYHIKRLRTSQDRAGFMLVLKVLGDYNYNYVVLVGEVTANFCG
jgi:hypothetical protein